ncbi:hypothetical protein DL768_007425 [Monosporascus sp. mg162]|nr:hypothetical protein DL768_007425 [Monosporascus sp. mg162]
MHWSPHLAKQTGLRVPEVRRRLYHYLDSGLSNNVEVRTEALRGLSALWTCPNQLWKAWPALEDKIVASDLDNHSTYAPKTMRDELSSLAKEQELQLGNKAAATQARGSTPRFQVVC